MFFADYFDDDYFDVEYWGSPILAPDWVTDASVSVGWTEGNEVANTWTAETATTDGWNV
jgi:hypothetical protein